MVCNSDGKDLPEEQESSKRPVGEKVIRCAECGAELREGAEFCLYCGRKNCVTVPVWVISLAVTVAAAVICLIGYIIPIPGGIPVVSQLISGRFEIIYCSLLLLGIYCLKTKDAAFLAIFSGVVYGGIDGICRWKEFAVAGQGIPRKYLLGCFLLQVCVLFVWSMTVKLIQTKARQGSYLLLFGVLITVPFWRLVIWGVERFLAVICLQEKWRLEPFSLYVKYMIINLLFSVILQMICSGVVTMVYLKKIGSDFRIKIGRKAA